MKKSDSQRVGNEDLAVLLNGISMTQGGLRSHVRVQEFVKRRSEEREAKKNTSIHEENNMYDEATTLADENRRGFVDCNKKLSTLVDNHVKLGNDDSDIMTPHVHKEKRKRKEERKNKSKNTSLRACKK
jgi:hypothetical protein